MREVNVTELSLSLLAAKVAIHPFGTKVELGVGILLGQRLKGALEVISGDIALATFVEHRKGDAVVGICLVQLAGSVSPGGK